MVRAAFLLSLALPAMAGATTADDGEIIAAAPAIAAAVIAPASTTTAEITVTADRPGITARQRAVPPQLSLAERLAYRQIFLDIDAGRYAAAERGLAAIGPGLLTETARAQLIAARGSARLSRAQLCDWLAANRDLPQAPRIAQIAARLPGDAVPLPLLPSLRPFRTVTYAPAHIEVSEQDARTGAAIKAMLAEDRNAEAEARWQADGAALSPAARSGWAQRIAWSYYAANDNEAALRLGRAAADTAGPLPSQSAALGAWTAGLAAWRLGRFEVAAQAFDLVADRAPPADLAAAAAYWASRAHLAAGRAELVAPRLETAARASNNFYGLLARQMLGLKPAHDWSEPDFITADWNHLKDLPGARRAAALVEIGQLGLGDRELRYLAQTARPDDYPALLRLAARLNLPATQYSLATRPPEGIEAPLSARYPAPDWLPARGWRVERALVFAHALQESTFVTTATSRAGAKGVMQLMPATARQVKAQMDAATVTGLAPSTSGDLADPAFNIEVGQTYLEALRDSQHTQGLLPKVIAAYNAGPGSVMRWNTSLDDQGDPLLFIESIPFKETRHYVEVVMRNLWMYQLRDGVTPPSMTAIATGLWPRFPGLPGAPGVKLAPRPVVTAPTPVDRDPDPQVSASATGN